MGRVKSAQVKKFAKKLLEQHKEHFTGDFERNKKVVSSLIDTSKKLRNSIAGYVTRLVRKK